ncbi:Ig-like domain-containing protein, partial [Brevibacillus centrosporus]|uniref:Ig-like domain-containing protein n=2 Tax=Brevibacillus centrosporus TaxID=54910 RepID=UPI0016069353
PADNQTLAEGNKLTVQGSATEADNGNVVTIYGQINSQPRRALHSQVSNGSSPISFAKDLVFTGDRIYFEGVDISGPLTEGTTNTLKVWAEDDQQGKSNEVTRSFSIQINDPPTITVDPYTPTQTGLIEPDTITLSGNATDPNGNTMTVTGQLNSGAAQTLLNGVASGAWSYTFPVSSLQSGANTVTITATDQFGKVREKKFNLTKAEQKVPLKKGTARYKVIPPLGTAEGILAWLKREKGDLSVESYASFVDAGQQENYAACMVSSVDLTPDIAEDEIVYSTFNGAKADIMFKQIFLRTNTASTQAATSLVGAIE